VTEADVRARVAAEVQRAGSQLALAREWGCDKSYLCDVVNGRRAPGPLVLGPLGLVRVVVVSYEPAKGVGE
jgi:hypothetical protein